MLVSREHLERTFRTLDSAMIRGRLLTGDLSTEAKEVALAELERREKTGETAHESPVETPIALSQTILEALPSRPVMKAVMGMYVAFVTLCLVIMTFDPPWVTSAKNIGTGMLGGVATFAMGLPWDYVFMNILGPHVADDIATYMFICLSGVVVNLAVFAWYFKRS